MTKYNLLIKPFFMTDAMKASVVTEEKLIDRIKNPIVKDNKEYAPLYVFGTPNFPYLPAEGDPDSARACYDNIKDYEAIVLDFDAGRTVDSFIEDFKDKFKFFLYTSYNHGYKPTPRFRVIIPLLNPIPMHMLDGGGYRHIMEGMFPDIDGTSFDRGHFQVIPCVRQKNEPNYRYYINQSNKLFCITEDQIKKADKLVYRLHSQMKMFSEAAQRLHEELYGREWNDDDEEKRIQNQLKWAQSYLDTNCFQGNRDICCFEVLKYLSKNGLISYAYSLSVPSDFQKEWEAKVRRFYK